MAENKRLLAGALGLAGLLVGSTYLLSRRKATGSPGQTAPTMDVKVAFSGGPAGTLPDPKGGNLPDLTTTVTNTGNAEAQIKLSVPIVGPGGEQVPFRWSAYPDQDGLTYNPDRSQVSLTLPPGQSKAIKWRANWSGNPGNYQSVAIVEVSGMPQKAFSGPSFTIAAIPADANLTFSGGPSGTIQDPQGGRLPDLVTALQNTGGLPATFTVRVDIQTSAGAVTPFKWFAFEGQPGLSYSQDRSQVSVNLNPGQSVQIRWGTTWSGNPGSYRSVATVSW